jgi:hypothetical protein
MGQQGVEMRSEEIVANQRSFDAMRIGVVTDPLGTENTAALRLLILHLNSLQTFFEFELLPGPPSDPLLALLASKWAINRDQVKAEMEPFVKHMRGYVDEQKREFEEGQKYPLESPPARFVILANALFDDNFYSARMPNDAPTCAIVALRNWKRSMAPPSLLEFFLVLVLRQAVALACPPLSGAVHYGTKGCLFDLNQQLGDVGYKVLNGFICNHCARVLREGGHACLEEQLTTILRKGWLGSPAQPSSAVSIASNLGHNLFLTKGLKPTFWESVRSTLQQETVKQSLAVIGTVLGAALIFYLGFKSGG